MEKYKIATVCVSGVTAVSIDLKPIPRGITGAVVEFLYDDDIWAGLRKKVAFRGTGEVEILCDGDTVIFPAEVAQRAKTRVTVGVTGVNADGTEAIPTLWADLGTVRDSAYGDYPAAGEPVPPVWAQLLAMIGTLNNLNTEARENLVAAINEVLSKVGTGGGTGTEEQIAQAVEDYIAEHPVQGEPGKDGQDGKDGSPGADGYSPTASVEQTTTGAVITVTDKNGTTTATVVNGKDGKDGADGYTPIKGADYFDGEPGQKGDKGDPGEKGEQGIQGIPGEKGEKGDPGAQGPKGEKGDPGAQGDPGKDGTSVAVKSVSESTEDGGSNVVTFSDGKTLTVKNGKNGAAGKTPARGTDYWTVADQEAIVQQVIATLGTPVFGRVDAGNNIILTGELVDGTYTLKYEDAEGKTTDIGSLKIGGASYTNQLPISTDANGAIYNGTGYMVGYRFKSSSDEAALSVAGATNPAFLTGFIPIANGQTVRLKNCYIDTNGVNGSPSSTETKNYYGEACSSMNILLCNAQKVTQNAVSWVNAATSEYFTMTPDADGIVTEFTINRDSIAYIRLNLAGDAPNAIITVDEPITD